MNQKKYNEIYLLSCNDDELQQNRNALVAQGILLVLEKYNFLELCDFFSGYNSFYGPARARTICSFELEIFDEYLFKNVDFSFDLFVDGGWMNHYEDLTQSEQREMIKLGFCFYLACQFAKFNKSFFDSEPTPTRVGYIMSKNNQDGLQVN